MDFGIVQGIAVAHKNGDPMIDVGAIQALKGRGLVGDRYSRGDGSWNKDRPGHRQVTLINARFVRRSGFTHLETRRNLMVDVELMWLIGREFEVGEALMRGVKYCDPCMRPSKLSGKSMPFDEDFHDCGGLVAEVLRTGVIRVGSRVIPPKKSY